MKKSRFTEQQIAYALRQAETGASVEEITRKMGITQATFYRWKKKYAGMGVAELRQLKQLEAENRKLKRLVWGTRVSAGTVSDLNKKVYKQIDTWRNRKLQGHYPYVYLNGIALKRTWGGEVRYVSVLVAIPEQGLCQSVGQHVGLLAWLVVQNKLIFRVLNGYGAHLRACHYLKTEGIGLETTRQGTLTEELQTDVLDATSQMGLLRQQTDA